MARIRRTKSTKIYGGYPIIRGLGILVFLLKTSTSLWAKACKQVIDYYPNWNGMIGVNWLILRV